MTNIYARDLKPELLKDSFMGKGFEEALKRADADGEDMIIGVFEDSWKKSAGVITANHNSKKEKLAKLLESAKKLEDKPVVIPEREHFIDSDGKKVYIPIDYPEISLEEHNQALVNYYEARDRARAKVWNVNCQKCGVQMEACDGFVPKYCANCVFGEKKCAREGCNVYSKNLYCSQDCKDQDDAESAQREAEWQSNEQNQVISESEI